MFHSSLCAVHGLGGNAFDTWTANNGTMWLRDLLPQKDTALAGNFRTMTFGYSSELTDKRNISGIVEWATYLLQGLSSVRQTEAVCS